MANTNSPFGFALTGVSGGSTPPTFGHIWRKVANGNTEAIFKGDPVEDLGTGYVRQWNATSVVSRLVGIFDGCEFFSTVAKRKVFSPYWPGSGATGDIDVRLIPLIGSTPLDFLVRSSGTAIAFADGGTNADVSIGTGNTATGQSGASLDQATLGTTATLPFTVVGLYSDVMPGGIDGTDNTASYNIVRVRANVTQTTGIA